MIGWQIETESEPAQNREVRKRWLFKRRTVSQREGLKEIGTGSGIVAGHEVYPEEGHFCPDVTTADWISRLIVIITVSDRQRSSVIQPRFSERCVSSMRTCVCALVRTRTLDICVFMTLWVCVCVGISSRQWWSRFLTKQLGWMSTDCNSDNTTPHYQPSPAVTENQGFRETDGGVNIKMKLFIKHRRICLLSSDGVNIFKDAEQDKYGRTCGQTIHFLYIFNGSDFPHPDIFTGCTNWNMLEFWKQFPLNRL